MPDIAFEPIGGFSYKERRTDSHVYFVGGPFNNWWSSTFSAVPFPGFAPQTFNCAEQYMMAAKALLFHDVAVYETIMRETNPREQKALGRKVRNFDPTLWGCCARELVARGVTSKFSQNAELREYLLGTENRTMVEGAHYDEVWGVRLAWNDPAIEDESNWRGTNWLGEVLMHVRHTLKFASSDPNQVKANHGNTGLVQE